MNQARRLVERATHYLRAEGVTGLLRRGFSWLWWLTQSGRFWIERRVVARITWQSLDGERRPLFIHPYNRTWRNERAVEIPMALEVMGCFPDGRGLEIGNVLAHYALIDHLVVDKYEVAPGVQNIDVMDIRDSEGFDYIIAVSTLEHVGVDEDDQREGKAVDAVEHLRSMLRPSGQLFVTCPIGYNSAIDELALRRGNGTDRQWFLNRLRFVNRWRAVDATLVKPGYDERVPTARALWMAQFGPKGV